MDGQQLALRPAIQRFFEALPLAELGISPAQIADGMDEIHAHLQRVGLDAHHARKAKVPFHVAATDGDNYPHLRRFHLGATDLLQMSLPAELLPWLQRLFSSPVPPVCAEIQNLIARLAINPATSNVERAFVEFLLYQGARLNLVVAAWVNEREFASSGSRLADIDRLAHEELTWLLEHAEDLGPEDRPLHVLVAVGMERLTQHVQDLLRELRTVAEEVGAAQSERSVFEAKLEAYLRDLNLTDAVLVRNRFAPEVGEQRLPLEILQAEHPLALDGMSRAAMDQRVKRLVDHLDETRGLPPRRELALIDVIEQHLLQEEQP